MAKYEEQIAEEETNYKALVGEREREEEQLHCDVKELFRQLDEKSSTEKEARPPVSPAPTQRGYESTGSVITAINTKGSYAEVAKRKGKEKEGKDHRQNDYQDSHYLFFLIIFYLKSQYLHSPPADSHHLHRGNHHRQC